MKQIVHVNQHVIKANKKDNTRLPVLTCKTYLGNSYAHEVDIIVKGEVVGTFKYSPDKPLSCGAHVWFESDSNIVTLNRRITSADT